MKIEAIIEKMQKFGKDRFLLLFLIGITCIVIAIPIDKKNNATDKNKDSKVRQERNLLSDSETFNEQTNDQDLNTLQSDGMTVNEYGNYMSRQLENFLKDMEGVGKVRVFVVMQSSSEIIVAHNSPYTRRSEDETSSDSSHSVTETENESQIVLYEKEDGSQAPIIIKRLEPSVRGIVVASQGAESKAVRNNISGALQALFGIDEHKIKVVKLNT